MLFAGNLFQKISSEIICQPFEKKTQSNVFTLVNDNLLIVAEKDKLKKYWIDDDENVHSEEIIQIETINEIASVEDTIFCLQETTTGSKLIEVKNGEKREFDVELDFDPIFASQDNWILTNHVLKSYF